MQSSLLGWSTINITCFFNRHTVYEFDDEEALLNYHQNNYKKVRAGISFMKATSGLSKDVEYTIRVARKDVNDRWLTKNVYPFFQLTGPRNNESTGGKPGKSMGYF